MPERIPQSTTIRVPLKAYLSSDHISPATGKTIAITISKNGAAYGNPSAGATNATEIASGSYYVDLSTTDTGTLGPLFLLGTAATVDPVEVIYDVCKATNAGFTALPDTACTTNASILTSGTGTAQISVTSGLVTLAAVTHTGAVIPTVTTVTTTTNLTNLPAITTDWVTGTGVAASAVTKIQAGLATPTNITAGTITTVTNLTNAPTAGDFTATMKTSIGTAVAASAVASVTGNVGGNVTGSVGSVTGLTTATISAATWDLATAGHTTSGTFGAAMAAAGAAGDPWSTSLPGSYGAGTAGNIVGNRIDAAITSRLAPTVAARTLDVSATGEAGIDWANIGSPTTTVAFTGTTVGTVTTYTGDTPQTGDSYARIGAAGAGLTALGDTRVANLDATVSSRLSTAGYTAPPSAATVATAVLTTQMTESYNADGVVPTLAQAQFVQMQRLTEFSITASTITVKKLDGTTTAYTLTMDAAAGSATSSTRAT